MGRSLSANGFMEMAPRARSKRGHKKEKASEDAARIVQAAYGAYGMGFGEIQNSLDRQAELAQRALQGSRDTITNFQ